jgi:hypothetical protein
MVMTTSAARTDRRSRAWVHGGSPMRSAGSTNAG